MRHKQAPKHLSTETPEFGLSVFRYFGTLPLRHFGVLASLLVLLGAACRPQYLTIRPGCTFRVMDEDTGLPIPDAKIRVVTLNAERDTVGTWNLRTDELGLAGMATVRELKRREVGGASKPDAYDFIAGLEAEGYQYYSLRIAPGLVVVRLSRNYSVACLGGVVEWSSGQVV